MPRDDYDDRDDAGSSSKADPKQQGLERRHRRQLAQLRSWSQMVARCAQLELPSLPTSDPNRVKTRGDPAAAFAVVLQGVSGWPMHRGLLRRIKANKNVVVYSVNVSFFFPPTRSFFGSTWQSGPGVAHKEAGGSDATLSSFRVEMNDAFLWYTYVDDPRARVVVELVASEVNQEHGVVVASYGCGWAFLDPSPFGRRGMASVEGGEDTPSGSSMVSSPLFKGSPRSLCVDEASPDHLEGKAVLRYRVVQHHALLKAKHLLCENEIVGSRDVVPGLAKRPILQDVRATGAQDKHSKRQLQTQKRAAVFGCTVVASSSSSREGGSESGSDESSQGSSSEHLWVGIPRAVRLAPTLCLKLSRLLVRVQDCNEMEGALRKHFDWSLDADETPVDSLRRLQGRGGNGPATAVEREALKTLALTEPLTCRFRVLERRLRLCLHNGHTLCDLGVTVALGERDRTTAENEGNQGPVTELFPLSARGGEDKHLVVSLPRFCRSKHMALVAVLEYTVRPDQSGRRLPSPAKEGLDFTQSDGPADAHLTKHSASATVVLGAAAVLPFDGAKLRLRGSMDPRLCAAADHPTGRFALPLAMNDVVRTVASQIPGAPTAWPPPGADDLFNGDRSSDRDKPLRLVRFKCEAEDGEGPVKDETPADPADEEETRAEKEDEEEDDKEDTAKGDSYKDSSEEEEDYSSSEEEDKDRASGKENDDEVSRSMSRGKKGGKMRKKADARRVRRDERRDERAEPIGHRPLRKEYLDAASPRSQDPSLDTASDDYHLTRNRTHLGVSFDAHPLRDSPPPVSHPREDQPLLGLMSSLLGQALAAPLGRDFSAMHQRPELETTLLDHSAPTLAASLLGPHVLGGSAQVAGHGLSDHELSDHGLSRASRARLGQRGTMGWAMGTDFSAGHNDLALEMHGPAVRAEMADARCLNVLSLRFAAYRAPDKASPLPRVVTFSYRFFDRPPTRSARAVLNLDVGKDGAGMSNATPRVLVAEDNAERGFGSAPEEKIVFDTSVVAAAEAQCFFAYLATRSMFIDVWDGDSLLHLGTVSLPLQPFLRQGRPMVQHAREYDVVAPLGDVPGGQTVLHGRGNAVEGCVVGKLQLVGVCFGEAGKGGRPGAEGPVPPSSSPQPDAGSSLNWRFGMSQGEGDLAQAASRPGGPAYRKRSRPMVVASAEAGQAAIAVMKAARPAAAPSKSGDRHGEGTALSYEEVLLAARRFADTAEGRKGCVAYRGRLLELLDVPSLGAAEERLVADLTKLEDGGRPLEKLVALLDRHGDGNIHFSDLVDGLRSLCPGSFGRLKEREAKLLVGRVIGNDSGQITAEALAAWVRARQDTQPTCAALSMLVGKAERKLGVTGSDAWAAHVMEDGESVSVDKFLHGVRTLQQSLGSDSHSASKHLGDPQLRRFARSLESLGRGRVSLKALMKKLGRPFVAVVGGVKAALKDLASSGASVEEAFCTAWDGDGRLSPSDLVAFLGLKGTPQALNEAKALASDAASGLLVLRDLFGGAGLSFEAHVRERLGATLMLAEQRAPLDQVFGAWNVSGSGCLTAPELLAGLRGLGTPLMAQLSLADASALLRGMGGGRLTDLVGVAGKDPKAFLAAKLKRVVLACEERGGASLQALFRTWDVGGSGAVTVGELERGLEAMGVFDTGGHLDGHLDKAQVRSLLSALSPQGGAGAGAVHFRDLMGLLGRSFGSYVEARLHDVVAKSKVSLQDVFGAIDADGDGRVTALELEAGLKQIAGFEDVTAADMALLIAKHDAAGSGSLDLDDFATALGQRFAAKDVEAASAARLLAACKAKGLAPVDLGRRFAAVWDAAGTGTVTPQTLASGLVAAGLAAQAAAGLASALATGDQVTRGSWLGFCQRRNLLTAAEAEALALAAQPQAPVAAEGTASAVDDSVEEGKSGERGDGGGSVVAEAEATGVVTAEYTFSSDPSTAAMERKLRRVAQNFQARVERGGGGSDVEGLFRAYDVKGSGCVLRSEFVNVLMQLGLSLLDIPTAAGGGGGGGVEDGAAERRRRLAQLSKVKGADLEKRTVRLRARQPGLLMAAQDGDEGGGDGSEELALLKWYREGAKKDMVRKLVESGVKAEYHVLARFGETIFFEHQVTNPFGHEERLRVEMDASRPELRLVTSCEEWRHLRAHCPPPPGLPPLGLASPEEDLLAVDKAGAQLWVGSRETVAVPFAFLCLSAPGRTPRDDEPHTIAVRVVSVAHGLVVAMLQVHVHPRPPVVHRTLRFHDAEGAIVKRTVLVHGRRRCELVPVEGEGARRVLVECRAASDGGDAQEVRLKYSKLGPFPSSGDFYLIAYADGHFRAKVDELWHVVVSSRLRKDVNAPLGGSAAAELVVRGDRAGDRRVMAFASNEVEVSFDPSGPFALHPNAFNRVGLRFAPRGVAGTRKAHVHLVDANTRQLVAAWLLTCVAAPPEVTRHLDADAIVGTPSHKKVPLTNPWGRPQTYRLRSSDPSVMRPKQDRVTLEAFGTTYLRLYLAAPTTAGVSEVFLLVNDEADQSDECFRIVIRAEW